MAIDVSIVIPAYNEALRLPSTLQALEATVFPWTTEVIVVCDGCTDNTAEVAARKWGSLCVRVLRYDTNRGKGFAVRKGVFAATGDLVLFMDADGATPVKEIKTLVNACRVCDANVVIGSRRMPETRIERQPIHRHLLGHALSLLTRSALGLPFKDTQCGFKLFDRKSAEAIFAQARLDGFEFDLEVLFLACRLGFAVEEVGIEWRDVPGSKVHPVRDGLRMLRLICRLRWLHPASSFSRKGESYA